MSPIELALRQVADSVAKHLLQRKPWYQEDACFLVDLREAQAKIEALVEDAKKAARSEERQACARVVDVLALRAGGLGWTREAQLVGGRLQEAAQAIRARGAG